MKIWDILRAMAETKGWLREQAKLWSAKYFPGPQQDVASMVSRLLVANLGITFDMLKPSSRFLEDLAMDEHEPLELVMALKEELKFELSYEEVARLQTVTDLVNYLHGEIRTRSSVPLVKVL